MLVALDAALLLQGNLGFAEQVVDRGTQFVGHIGGYLAQLYKAFGQALKHGVERVDHGQQFFRRALAVEAFGQVADADPLGMPGQAAQRQQAAMNQQVTHQRQDDRGDTRQDVDAESITGEHRGALGHQAAAGDLQAAQVAGVDGHGHQREGNAVQAW